MRGVGASLWPRWCCKGERAVGGGVGRGEAEAGSWGQKREGLQVMTGYGTLSVGIHERFEKGSDMQLRKLELPAV